MSGKGSSPRPISVSSADFSDKWNAVFGPKDPKQNKQEQLELPPETLEDKPLVKPE